MTSNERIEHGSAWLDVEMPPPGEPITEIPDALLGRTPGPEHKTLDEINVHQPNKEHTMNTTTIPDPRAPRSLAPELGREVTQPEHLRLDAATRTLKQGEPGYTAHDPVTVSRLELATLLRQAERDAKSLRSIRDGIRGVL